MDLRNNALFTTHSHLVSIHHHLHKPLWRTYTSSLVVAGGDYFVITQLPWGREAPTSSVFMSVCLSVSKPISQNRGERKEGVTWQNHSYYEIVGLHFNSTRPCQGHHMPACQPGLLETRCYWTKAAAPQRHTQQLFSVATYHLMTLMEGKATYGRNTSSLKGGTTPAPRKHRLLLQREKQKQLIQMCTFRDTSREVDVSEPDIFGTFPNPRLAA